MTGFFNGHFGGSNGAGLALANIYNQLNQQAQMQGYQDVYMELSWASCGLIVLAFLLSKKAGPGRGRRRRDALERVLLDIQVLGRR